ncbi:hypothetical protein H2202_001743 [Exophiala xenobiotica]|nr:hypothetical protein H2202_001743 [Exophiala xenobiotica]
MSSDAERQVSVGGEDEARHEKHESHDDNSIERVATFESPFDFPAWRKWIMTTLLGGMAAAITFGSSVWSSTIPVTSKQFDVSETVAVLGVSLYVLGFALGPIVWGPLSELKGRRLPMFSGFFIWALLQIPVGVANNLPAILACRLLAGCFGAAPMTLISAVYADFWMPAERGTATAVYSAAVYIGPTLGPIFGSLLTESSLGWHWTAWITLIMGVAAGIPAFLFVPETYRPVLQARANRKARLANNGGFPHGEDIEQSATFQVFVSNFAEGRGWDPRVASLPFLSILVSVLVASVGVAWYSRKYYRPRLQARGSVLPEDRLPPIMLGSVLLPAGLFWFGWCSSSHISPVPQIIAGLLIGSGIMLIFTNGVAYIVDIYLDSAASALAANTYCVRLLWDTVIPSVIVTLIHLGNATLLIGFRNQAHMADIVLAASLDGHLAAWADDAVCAAGSPDQCENGT